VQEPQELFSIQIVLLPALQAACDLLRDARALRYIQGSKRRATGGMPLQRAALQARPQELFRRLPNPEYSASDWAAKYKADGWGNITSDVEERGEDMLVSCLSGACSAT